MGHCPKAFLGYELTGLPTNTVCFVLYSNQSSLKMLYELYLALGQFSYFFT